MESPPPLVYDFIFSYFKQREIIYVKFLIGAMS